MTITTIEITITDRIIESATPLANDSFITLNGTTNTVEALLRAGCIRQTGELFTVADENDSAILSVHNFTDRDITIENF